MPQQDTWIDVEEPKEDNVWEDISSLNPPKSIRPETKQFTQSVMKGDSIYGQEPEKEPDTWWGGFRKSISDELGEAFSAKNPMLQSAARPETLSDFSNLVLPSGIPNLRRLLPKGILSKGKLPQIAESISSGVVPDDIIPSVKPRMRANLDKSFTNLDTGEVIPRQSVADELIPEQGLAKVEPELHQAVGDDIVERGGIQYKKTGINPDTGQSTYEPFHEAVGDADIYDISDTPLPDELDYVGPPKSIIDEADDISRLGTAKDITPPGQKPLDWKTDPQKAVNMMAAKARRLREKALSGEPVTPVEIKKTIPPDDIPKLIEESSVELKNISPDLPPEIQESLYRKISNFNRSLLTAIDFSAPGRQGKGLITHKGYWTSFDDMFKSWGSKKAYENVRISIVEDPSNLFKPRIEFKNKSYADEVGLILTDLVKNREEIFRSRLAEKIPGVARSLRAYTAFMNKTRANVFKELINSAKKAGRDPELDLPLGRQIANSINVSTGRGSFGQLEESATAMKILNEVFFAPKLMASRVQMFSRVLNPKLYTKADPIIRKEALRSLFGIVGTATLVGELARLGGAYVSNNYTSSDYRKIRIGDTRIDNLSGLQQYGVATARFLSGKSTSSTSGKTSDLTRPKFGGQTRASVITDFITNKLAPIPSLVWAWMNTREFDGEPFEIKQALMNRTVPIVMQDIIELYNEDPSLLPLGLAPLMGEGIQTYGR